MAIGKPPPHCSAVTRVRRCGRPDLRCGHLPPGAWAIRRTRVMASLPKIRRGLVTPPLPFAEAERKSRSNDDEHNTVPGRLPTDFWEVGAKASIRAKASNTRLQIEGT